MAQPFKNAVMTNSGIKLLNDAQSGECSIEFTRIAVGNGEYTEEEKEKDKLITATGLKKEKQTYPIHSKKKKNDNSVVLTCNITNYDESTKSSVITEGFYINEIAVFARASGTDAEVLYSIAVTAGETGDYMPPYNGYNPASIIQSYVVSVHNAQEIEISFLPGLYALQEDVNAVLDKIESMEETVKNISFSGTLAAKEDIEEMTQELLKESRLTEIEPQGTRTATAQEVEEVIAGLDHVLD